MPKHVAIILDGNRRLAKRLVAQPWQGHAWGAKKVKELLKWVKETEIKYVTLYSFSVQNFKRPKKEFDYLMRLFEKEFSAITNPNHEAHKYKVRVRAIGRINLFPKKVQNAIAAAEAATKKYNKYFLNIAVAYGGQEEITDAMVKIAKKVATGLKLEQINEKMIKESLYTNGIPYPDLIIRTGGEKRLSNFLLWQSAYSELYFCEKMWPEFEKKDFLEAIGEFQARQRRFGR